MIKLFHIENYVIDTSDFNHALHDTGVVELEEKFAEFVGAKYACSISSATNAIFLIFLNKNVTINIPSIIPPVVPNALINGGNTVNFKDDITWVGSSYVLHEFDDYKVIDSAQQVRKNQFKEEAESQDLMFFSFYPTKPVGSLDGGMIVSDDYDKICYYKEAVLNGMSYAENNWDRRIKFPGWKMYLSSFQAKIACENLKKLPQKIEKIQQVREHYNKELGYHNNSDHLYRILVEDNKKFIDYARHKNVICGIHYEALHLNSVYNRGIDFKCPKSEKISKSTVSIPLHEKLSIEEVEYIINMVKEYQ